MTVRLCGMTAFVCGKGLCVFCTRCGQQNQPDARFCARCGTTLLRPGEPLSDADSDALLAATRAGLASFKAPRALQIVDSWPLSGTGKIQRGVLRERAENAVREESR